MARFSAFLVPILLLVAASGLAATVARLFALAVGEAIVAGLGILFVLGAVHGGLQRVRERRLLDRRLQDIGATEEALTRRVGGLAGRVDLLERRERDRAADAEGPAGEDAMLALVGRIGGAVAVLDQRLDRLEGRRGEPAGGRPPAAGGDGPPRARDEARLREAVAEAVRAGRFEFLLQPIVTLPQRRPRYYELFTRLKDEDGALLASSDVLPAAAALGLLPEIDRAALPQMVEVLQRLSARQRDVGVFSKLSLASLTDGKAFDDLLAFASAHRPFADGLVFAFTQAEVGRIGAIEQEGLATLADLGFRFAMDRTTDLRANFQALAAKRFRFVKAATDVLLSPGRKGPDIAPADMADMIARFGLDLIVERVDAEPQVLELLECKVGLAQGAVFGTPRPVKADASVAVR